MVPLSRSPQKPVHCGTLINASIKGLNIQRYCLVATAFLNEDHDRLLCRWCGLQINSSENSSTDNHLSITPKFCGQNVTRPYQVQTPFVNNPVSASKSQSLSFHSTIALLIG
ncbi:hypothetical protein MSAN_00780900 [Mycena sanguinolenta]|uniref:Uncharacterized protein n=1 Tax=Mycena sanguinolenta TaxID=230812 RepID=A0A8H7DDG7_9AGAR|nr:hypothetical protein MSAN_00780900 [Mycena sanguinolenta]